MASRTADGKHTKRFIVLKKSESDDKFVRSISVPQYFETKELAQAAIDPPADAITDRAVGREIAGARKRSRRHVRCLAGKQ